MNIVVVGGGTAGWMSALYAKIIYPQYPITLIESEEVGILGAGEGSTPILIEFLLFLGIPVEELIKECNISIKNGIKFSGWSDKNKSYFHPFYSQSSASNDYNFSLYNMLENNTGFAHIFAKKFNHKLKDYCFVEKFSEQNKVPFFQSVKKIGNEILYNQQSNISIHFDASLLAKYLRKIGESRGIIRKEGLVKKINTDKDGYINELETDRENIKTDFVIDCTGFKRLIIGNFYKSSWKSHNKSLPMNSAIPFFLPQDKNIPPYTESIAMDYGWMWKIPLQHRYGCGYVFDNNYISEDDAKKELDNYFGFEISSPRTFKFNAGCFEKIWIKNSLAVGLSSGFIEPLEATSIFQAIRVLNDFFGSYNNIYTKNENIKEKFNKKYLLETNEIVDFLYLHYVTDKKNNNFWFDFKKNNEMPDFINYILSVIKERPIDESIDFVKRQNVFGSSSYFYILIGNNIINENMLNKYFSIMKNDKTQDYLNILSNQNKVIPQLIDHNDFLMKEKK
jgi:tryptophan halogenase